MPRVLLAIVSAAIVAAESTDPILRVVGVAGVLLAVLTSLRFMRTESRSVIRTLRSELGRVAEEQTVLRHELHRERARCDDLERVVQELRLRLDGLHGPE